MPKSSLDPKGEIEVNQQKSAVSLLCQPYDDPSCSFLMLERITPGGKLAFGRYDLAADEDNPGKLTIQGKWEYTDESKQASERLAQKILQGKNTYGKSWSITDCQGAYLSQRITGIMRNKDHKDIADARLEDVFGFWRQLLTQFLGDDKQLPQSMGELDEVMPHHRDAKGEDARYRAVRHQVAEETLKQHHLWDAYSQTLKSLDQQHGPFSVSMGNKFHKSDNLLSQQGCRMVDQGVSELVNVLDTHENWFSRMWSRFVRKTMTISCKSFLNELLDKNIAVLEVDKVEDASPSNQFDQPEPTLSLKILGSDGDKHLPLSITVGEAKRAGLDISSDATDLGNSGGLEL